MNKKIFLLISLIIISGFAIVSLAVSQINFGNNEIKINIEKGWNLVNYDTFEYLISNKYVKSEDVVVAWAFNPKTQEYIKMAEEMSDAETNKLNNLNKFWEDYDFGENYALFVYYKVTPDIPYISARDLHYFDGTSYWNFPMFKGWNFVGISPEILDNGGIETEFPSLKGNCNIEKAYGFEGGKWISLPLNSEMDYSSIGRGLIIKVSNDCKMRAGTSSQNGNGDLPAVPNLPGAENICSDSDNGLNYFVKGTVTGYNEDASARTITSVSDSCSGSTLHEWICKTSEEYDDENYACPNGCNNGACL